jgi:cyclic pyranopterin phosphate synthase
MDFVRFALERDLTIRFIEYMPVFGNENWSSLVVPGAEILATIGRHFPLRPLQGGPLAGPAREYAIGDRSARVGVITPTTGHFCGECNRIRIAATGFARSCLFGRDDVDLRPLLGEECGEELRQALVKLILGKPDHHCLTDAESFTAFSMADIGG